MQLKDMLSYAAESVLDDRAARISGDDDSLYSDALLCRYFNAAQDILCRRAWSICDMGNATAGVITLQTAKSTYPIHRSVVRILEVVPEDQDEPILNYADRALITPRPFRDSWFDIDSGNTASAGRPIAYSTETGTRLMRVFRTPSATENGLRLIMRVARLPIAYLTLDNLDAEPEVPAEYVLWLCDYAVGRCLLQPNVDDQYKTEGKRLLAEFDTRVREARQDRQRFALNEGHWSFDTSTSVLR